MRMQHTQHRNPVARFESLVRRMDIPDNRKRGTQPNARWFLRNAPVLNRSHQNLSDALNAARQIA